ncbi:MAG: hypothetical protein ACR2L2_05275 [Acidobacteriota bacterium]
MKVITGHVANGKLPPDIQDGTIVAVLAPDDAGFTLSPEQESELAAALEEIRAGDYVDGRVLLEELAGRPDK